MARIAIVLVRLACQSDSSVVALACCVGLGSYDIVLINPRSLQLSMYGHLVHDYLGQSKERTML